jgi:hypothetical protein
MPQRTQLFELLPWIGGLNTSTDPSLIGPNQLTVCDNVTFGPDGVKSKRDGINMDWDSGSNASRTIIRAHDFWFGSSSRTQRKVAVTSDGKVYSYASDGTRTELTVGGQAWSGTLTSCSIITFNNLCLIAVSGSSNTMKYWDGDLTHKVLDLYSDYSNTSISRASSGTTRTLVFNQAFGGANGSTVVITGAGDDAYNGTFTVASVTQTTVPNDTITYTGSSSLNESTAADTGITVGALAPKGSILREHGGRVYCNNKASLDSLEYCSPFDHTEWNGTGDSGAIPIGTGDGDPNGISAIFPTFQADLFVSKKTKLYRLVGTDPETIVIKKITDGLGCVSHNSVALVEQSDCLFVSEKGVHSLVTTDQFGDFASTYISKNIQTTFNEDFSAAQLPVCQAAYIPNLNAVAFAFTEESAANRVYSETSSNNAVYFYDIPSKEWYRWFDVPCASLMAASDSDKTRLYFGSHQGRMLKAFNSTNYDLDTSGTQKAVKLRLVTGQISLDGSRFTQKALKRFILYYRPEARHTISVTIKVDGQSIPTQNFFSFSRTSGGTPLGTGFVLGSTPLGSPSNFGPHIRTAYGVGRGFRITIEQSDVDAPAELQGIALEFEPAGVSYRSA